MAELAIIDIEPATRLRLFEELPKATANRSWLGEISDGKRRRGVVLSVSAQKEWVNNADKPAQRAAEEALPLLITLLKDASFYDRKKDLRILINTFGVAVEEQE